MITKMTDTKSNSYTNDTGIFTVEDQTYTSITYSKRNWKMLNVFTAAFLLRVTAGLIISWTICILPQPHGPNQSMRGLSTIFCLGSVIGASIAFLTIFKVEKKIFNYVSGLLVIVHGILLLIMWKNLYVLLIGNFLSGISNGLISISSIIHASELSTNSRRGWNIALLQVGITTGILIGLKISVQTVKISFEQKWFWYSNGIVLIICGILSIFATFFFVIDSPAFWTFKRNNLMAREVMLKVHNEVYETFDIINDLQEIQKFVNYGFEDVYRCLPIVYFTKQKYLLFCKIGLIRIAYVFGNGLTLNLLFLSYITRWIGLNGITLYILPRFFTEILIVIFIDGVGRRLFLIISAVCSGIILIIISSIIISLAPPIVIKFSNPVFCTLSILIISYQTFVGSGLSNSSSVMLGEIFNFHSKPFFNYFIFTLEYLCHIIIILFLNAQYFNLNAYIFLTAFLQILAGIITLYFMKETKGISILSSCKLFE